MALSERRSLDQSVAKTESGITRDQFLNNDPDAINRIYPYLIRFAERFTPNRDMAEDLVQTSLAKVVNPLRRKSNEDFVETGGSVIPYIYRAIVNTRINEVRREKKRGHSADYDNVSDHNLWDSKQNVEETVVFEIDGNETLTKIKDKVNVDFVEALYLAEVVGMSYLEVAKIQGVPLGTVQSRISRGRSSAKKALIADSS